MNTLMRSKKMLYLFISSLLIKLYQLLSRLILGRTILNCVFFFLYLLIFILCARGNRSHGVLEIIDGDLISPNYWYHSKYDILGYAHKIGIKHINFVHNYTHTHTHTLPSSPIRQPSSTLCNIHMYIIAKHHLST